MDYLVAWCDIPVLDLERAIRFYSQVSFAPAKNGNFPTLAAPLRA